jgi:hypothetical protein
VPAGILNNQYQQEVKKERVTQAHGISIKILKHFRIYGQDNQPISTS